MASSKRQSHDDDHDRDGQAPGNESKRRQGNSKQALIRFGQGINAQQLTDMIVRGVRKVVQEEFLPRLERHLRPRGESLNQTGTSGGRGRTFQLRFTKGLPREIFTNSKVLAEDMSHLEIVVCQCDAGSQDCIVRDGPLSSITVELCVLDSKLGSNSTKDWTAEEFRHSILRETRKRGELLSGDRFIKLTSGVGCIPKVCINDISKWAHNGKFRLGARVVEPISGEANIREAISEPLRVKDIRGESYKKPEIASLSDEIWRLKTIAKGGKRHKQLASHGIVTVKDLLLLLNTNPDLLKKIIGKSGKGTWEKLIKHAQTCALQDGGNCSTYHTTEQPIASQPYLPVGSLDSEPKHLVETAEHCTYMNSQAVGALQRDFRADHQEFSVPSTSTSHVGEVGHNGYPELPMWEFPDWFDANLWDLLGHPSGDEGQCSSHNPNPNSAAYISSKRKGTTVWDKIRNTLKVAMLYIYRAKRKAKLVPHNC